MGRIPSLKGGPFSLRLVEQGVSIKVVREVDVGVTRWAQILFGAEHIPVILILMHINIRPSINSRNDQVPLISQSL